MLKIFYQGKVDFDSKILPLKYNAIKIEHSETKISYLL